MKTIPAKVTPMLVKELDGLVKAGWFASRSEAIRDAIREMIKSMKIERAEVAIKEDIKWGLHGKD